MKNICLALVMLFALMGCTNGQDSSQSEAKYTVEHLDDFQEMVQYFSVASLSLVEPRKPFVNKSDPALDLTKGNELIHVIVYKTKKETFKLVLLDDSRPSKVVAVKEFK